MDTVESIQYVRTFYISPLYFLRVFFTSSSLAQASAANQLMLEERLDPCMSECFDWDEIPAAHIKMRKNEHKPGNMSVLVQATQTGLRTLEETIAVSKR